MNNEELLQVDSEEWKALTEKVYSELAEQEKEIARSNNRLFKAIETVKGKAFLRNLKMVLFDCYLSNYDKCTIVNSTTGKWQEERYGREIRGYWVDQWSVGMEGDSFAGFIYVKLKENKFIKCPYSC